jgi:hypothetical protein
LRDSTHSHAAFLARLFLHDVIARWALAGVAEEAAMTPIAARTSIRMLAAAALTGFVLAVSSTAGSALPGTPEQRKACTPDVLSLCGTEIPSVPKVIACMKRKQDQISSTCKTALGI